jgi:hypothetical protein
MMVRNVSYVMWSQRETDEEEEGPSETGTSWAQVGRGTRRTIWLLANRAIQIEISVGKSN